MVIEEVFNEARMNRCMAIVRKIINNAEKTKRFDYTIRATESVAGLPIRKLKRCYFAVGVGNDVVEVPFVDLLVVISALVQNHAAFKEMKGKRPKKFTIRLALSTTFTEDEAARLLSQVYIHTPYDKGKRLRVVEAPSLPDPEDDPQTPQ